MEVGDIHVGKQLSCVYTPQGLVPTTAVNPFGFGEKAFVEQDILMVLY